MKVFVALLLMLVAFPLLFWNEGRAVHTADSLAEGRVAAVDVPSEKVDPRNEGKLVHTTGRATTADTVSDPLFGVSVKAIALERKVAMYQWTEEKESKGRGADNYVYHYKKGWSQTVVDSAKFKAPDEHRNPGSMRYKSEKWTAAKTTLGAFTLSSTQVSRIAEAEPVKPTAPPPGSQAGTVREHEDGLYVGKNPDDPQLGDMLITFTKTPEADLSIVAQQVGHSFAPYVAKGGQTVDLQRKGNVSLQEMFTSADQENVSTLWGVRVTGFILMFIGFLLIMKPLSSMADSIPIVGDIVSSGTALIAFLLAAVMSLTTVGIGWIVYRPLVGIALLLVGAGAAYAIYHHIAKARANANIARPGA